ncbi:2-dehydro-3-deoxy-6-phosphogalactonate aldolase [Undibacterium sp. LX40W]|uniref:2-dehydro-3-deoxy-6-phosphogalactonate aldolase n=1 Tax=Undibacterium nitidum TaxID=2762298 RepID=A0A923KKN5_9BURK|nr:MULTISPECIES: 2-dehydro-3-deoxy-6-phosphogalactonate aldolase [Undibacterium]MBC3880980.1 2-dehydro-3-deoxy-6-phosphogalactonate aldolase [Undibacterium nitidum]MBC3890287.1 2-dehydro-3-deoxy-6-phosphogalactonate aldolase [Undibacterium sp. LX40W]
MISLKQSLSSLPLIAILRGIQNHEVLAYGRALYAQGFRCIEVPLNSPNAIESIRLLVEALPADCCLGAGTVMTTNQVEQVHSAGGRLIVMPHSDSKIIDAAKRLGMCCAPGVATLTEAFAAIEAGADAIKCFPSESVPPSVLKAWRSVLPADVLCVPVGGVTADAMDAYVKAGASGFGLGSNLYRAGDTIDAINLNAAAYVEAWAQISAG